MKKNIMVGLMVWVFAGVTMTGAQEPYYMPLAQSASVQQYAVPKTAVKIALTVEKETIVTGPYARFAQKYLGVIAPLTDKQNYVIKSARIGYVQPGDKTGPVGMISRGPVPRMRKDDYAAFPKVLPDKMDMQSRSLEDMAREAANTIFRLRKSRLDLITGDMGEYAFGGGMKAALEQIDKLEREYLELFMGKRVIEVTTKEFEVVPGAEKTNYIFTRFAPDAGILPDSDLSGSPVVLTIRVTDAPQATPDKAAKGTAYYRVPAQVEAIVSEGANELARSKGSMYQYGITVVGTR